MREVSCKATRMILEALEESGLDSQELARGMPVSIAVLRDPSARIDWETFTKFLERVEDLGRPHALTLDEIGALVLRVPSFDLLQRAARLVFSPRQLYEVAGRLAAPAFFPNVVVKQTWLGSGRLLVTGEVPPGYRESEAFFRLCMGNVAALPRLLDLPAAVVEEQSFSGRFGRQVLLLPPSHTLAVRFVRRARALGALSQAWRGVAKQQRELESSLEALRNSRRELSQLLEKLPDSVVIHRDGRVCWANAAFLDVLGVEKLEDVVDRHLRDFLPTEDRDSAKHAQETATASDRRPQYRVTRRDGSVRRLEAGTTQDVDFRGKPARLMVLRDVTERQRMQEQAAIADRLASIGALAAGVAHEINNPLAYVLLSIESATRQAGSHGDAADLKTTLAVAREGTERVIDIVRDLKTLSRVGDEASTAVDLHGVIDSTLALAQRALSAKARVVRRYGLTPLALGTPGKLGQVFLNLLSNAADAIPAGSPHEHTIVVATHKDSRGRVVAEISDTGNGIAPEIASRVFDPFFTTKPIGVGTGLGLAMAHRIVTELGGEISFESAPGGTTFRVVLPAAPAAPGSVAMEKAPAHTRRRPKGRVLIVDDEPALLDSLVRGISGTHEVIGATSAERALEILCNAGRFDAVLADLMMADLTGMDLFEAVRASHPGLERRFIFMTGGAFTERAQSFVAAVPNRCLAKPFGLSDVLHALDETMNAR